MVTGRPPFLGDDHVAIIGQHINTPPVAPTWHRPDCPKPLDSLIMRLLAKDPKQRPESAQDVWAALEAVSATGPVGAVPSTAIGQPEQGRSLDSMSTGVFVGRQKEMDQLRAALEETLSGRGRMVMLVGEPGIGKTRTAQELATYAGLRRCQVLWGRCYEGGGAPPYWPWVQAIRSYIRERDLEDLRREMGSTAPVIAEVVADVKDRLPGLQPPPELESPESARFRLFDSITAFLKSASKSQSIVLVLDDLHWSDKPSLTLLEFLARELANSRLLVVGTYRDVEINRRHPLSQTLGELTKERLFDRVLLRGIQRHDVERFIEVAAGLQPTPSLVDAVYTQTEGNPLFVTEVVRWLIQEGALSPGRVTRKTWTMPIPEGVRDVIGKRLDRLSTRCNEMLTTAAVIGRRFSLPALVSLNRDRSVTMEERVPEDRILDALEEALAARVLEELPNSPGRYQFTHALIQETLSGELSTTRRVRLHARIALALEDLYGDGAAEHAAELARHFAEAESQLGAEKLVKYSLIAGEQAMVATAYEEAAGHFRKGLEARGVAEDSTSPLPDDEAARLLHGLARASLPSSSLDQVPRLAGLITRVFDWYLKSGHPKEAIGTLLEQHSGPITAALYATIRRALELTTAGSFEHIVIRSRIAFQDAFRVGEDRSAFDTLDEVVESASRLDDPRAAAEANWLACALNVLALRPDAAVRCGQAGVSSGDACGNARLGLRTRSWLARANLAVGDADAARRLQGEGLEAAESLKDHYWIANAHALLARIGVLTGEWPSVLEQTAGAPPMGSSGYNIEFMARAETGDADGCRRCLQGFDDLGAWFLFEPPENFRLEARAHAAFVLDDRSLLTKLPPAFSLDPTAFALGHAYQKLERATAIANIGSRELALSAYRLVSPYPGAITPYGLSCSDRTLGRLAVLMGDPEAAARHFDDALAFLRRAGYRPELAWTCHDYSAMLMDWRGSGDREKAARLQEEGLRIAHELGMKPLIERFLTGKKILNA
jgi:hypothetical protein